MAAAVSSDTSPLASKFRGCMIGGLLGDCIGAPFEVEIGNFSGSSIPLGSLAIGSGGKVLKSTLKDFLTKLLAEAGSPRLLRYTDDTAMAISVAKSLIEKGTYDCNDMAKKFVDEYFREPGKGYGSNVMDVLYALRKENFVDTYGPSRHQFDGSGSYGNGAAMRVAPVALFGYSDENLVKQIAKESSLITHANQNGYNGAILQALAVHNALKADASSDFNPVQFVESLLEEMESIEEEITNVRPGEDKKPYCASLRRMKRIFEQQQHLDITAAEVANTFGNHVTAQKSVPAAIFSFLRGFYPIKEFETSSPFVRTLYFAIAIGGDTDTIGCMAGNIAGAYHGESSIPDSFKKRCQSVEELENLGGQLFQMSQKKLCKSEN